MAVECLGELEFNLAEVIGLDGVVELEGHDPHDLAKDASEFGA